jgi:hypothetical protein
MSYKQFKIGNRRIIGGYRITDATIPLRYWGEVVDFIQSKGGEVKVYEDRYVNGHDEPKLNGSARKTDVYADAFAGDSKSLRATLKGAIRNSPKGTTLKEFEDDFVGVGLSGGTAKTAVYRFEGHGYITSFHDDAGIRRWIITPKGQKRSDEIFND